MPQVIVFLNEEENEDIMRFSKKWELSKQETIKKMIRNFEEGEDSVGDEQ